MDLSKGDKAIKENIMSHTYYTTSNYPTTNGATACLVFHHCEDDECGLDYVDGYIISNDTHSEVSLFSDVDVTERGAAMDATREVLYELSVNAHGLSGETVAALAFDLLSEFQRAEF